MAMVSAGSPDALPTGLAPLPHHLAHAQGLGLVRHLHRAPRGSGRPQRLDKPLAACTPVPRLAALLGCQRLPCPETPHRNLEDFDAHDLRAAVEVTYLAALPHRPSQAQMALEAHQLPYEGRDNPPRLRWAGPGCRVGACGAIDAPKRRNKCPV